MPSAESSAHEGLELVDQRHFVSLSRIEAAPFLDLYLFDSFTRWNLHVSRGVPKAPNGNGREGTRPARWWTGHRVIICVAIKEFEGNAAPVSRRPPRYAQPCCPHVRPGRRRGRLPVAGWCVQSLGHANVTARSRYTSVQMGDASIVRFKRRYFPQMCPPQHAAGNVAARADMLIFYEPNSTGQ